MPKPSKKHHIVPKFYLEKFTDSKGRIAAWDKRSRTLINKPRKPEYFAYKECYYTIESNKLKNGDNPNKYEEEYSAIESRAAEVMAKLDNVNSSYSTSEKIWPLEVKQREWLSEFMALQFVRGDKYLNFRQTIVENNRKYVKEKNPAVGCFKEKWPKETENMLEENFDSSNAKIQEDRDRGRGKVYPYIYNRPWELLTIDKNIFITSDNPICLVPKQKILSYEKQVYSVGNAEYIYFPLNQNTCIKLHPHSIGEQNDSISLISNLEAKTINNLISEEAIDEIYCNPENKYFTPWLTAVKFM